MQEIYKPRIGITMGDPNGIGPEIIIKLLSCAEIQSICSPFVFADNDILDKAIKLVGMDVRYESDENCYLEIKQLKPGVIDTDAGGASLKSIKKAVKSVLENKLDAIVTAPISKKATYLAGSIYPGHTEMLAELSGSNEVAMMFEGSAFKVVLVTIHESLSEVPALIDKDKIFNIITLANDSLKKYFNIKYPKIAVCGLNPHAGESGSFGKEEIVHIKPAIDKAIKEGINIEGPFPSDTLFYYAANGKWDLVVAMYHDQGLIPFKMLNFEKGVNITLGLPFIRTSPDHGTAFDIAWKGTADPSSIIEAVKVAVRMYHYSQTE